LITGKKFNWNILALFILLAILIIDKIIFLVTFNFKYVISDDMIYWLSSTDYSRGIFHEPYFYGQNYNFMFESVVAIPFLYAAIPYHIALPLSTTIIFLFPWILFALVMYRKGFITESLIFLVVPICLPAGYSFISLGRCGFVSGLCITGLLVYSLLNPAKKSAVFLGAFSVGLGYLLNPNSLVFSLPVNLFLFLNNFKRISFYWINLITILPMLALEYQAKKFYELHPEYKVTWMWNFEFKTDLLKKGLAHLDNLMPYMTPVFWSVGWLSVLIIFLTGILLLPGSWKKGVSLIAGTLFIVFLLGLVKVHDQVPTIFYSSGRMFIGIPLLFALSLSWGLESLPFSKNRIRIVIFAMCIIVFIFKMISYHPNVKQNTQKTDFGPIAMKKVKDIKTDCAWLATIARDNKTDLIIFVPIWSLNVPILEFYDYGCPMVEKEFTKTLLTGYEKRTWVYMKEKSEVYPNILIFGASPDLLKNNEDGNFKLIHNDPQVIAIKNNTLKVEELLKKLDIKLSRNAW